MSQVSTVRGPVEVADLGPTYMHEHIFVLTADVQQNYPGEWGSEDARITDAVTKLGRWPPRASARSSTRPWSAWGMDRFGINLEIAFETRANTLVEMCRRGYAERMVLSQDAACYIDWIDPNVLPFLPQWHYLHIQDEVLPYAREHGVTEEQIAIMLTANPRRLFEQTR